MDHFNVRGGLYGDTTDKLAQLTTLEAAARDAAACLIEEADPYRIGGTLFGIGRQAEAPAPSQGLRF